MPRQATDSLSFILQAQYCEEDSDASETGFSHAPGNLLESSDIYGYIFYCKGSTLYAVSVPAAEKSFDNGENNQAYNSDFHFKVDFVGGSISFMTISISESYVAILLGNTLSILSVPNIILKVHHRLLMSNQQDLDPVDSFSSKIIGFQYCNHRSHDSQRTVEGSLIKSVDLKGLMIGADSSYNFQAAWSHSCNDEQLVIVLPDELLIVNPKSKSAEIKKSYSCVAWNPSAKGKENFIIAAQLNRIDLLNITTGSILATTTCNMDSTENNECKYFYCY